MDPRCVLQYMRWYHEPLDGPLAGQRIKLKGARSGGEPYVHTIGAVRRKHLGRYTCEIKNVMGVTECSAHLAITSGAPGSFGIIKTRSLTLTMAIVISQYWMQK